MLLPGAPMVRISIRCSTRWLNYRCADVCHCGATTKLCCGGAKAKNSAQWVNTPWNCRG